MRIVSGLLIVVLAVAVGAQTPAPEAAVAALPSVELPAEVARVLRDYEKGWTAHDAELLAGLFTEDGFVLSNGRPPVRGRAAIREAYAKSGGPLFLRALAYSIDGNTGYIIGGFRAKESEPDMGKFVLALRRVEGRWLIAADMDNMNSAPRRAAAATAP